MTVGQDMSRGLFYGFWTRAGHLDYELQSCANVFETCSESRGKRRGKAVSGTEIAGRGQRQYRSYQCRLGLHTARAPAI